MRKISIIITAIFICIFGEQKETTLLYPPFAHTWGVHRGTEEKLDMILGDVTDFDNPQGLAAVKLKSWDNPKNTDDDDEITCFGVNANRGQIIYNTSMHSLGIYGRNGSGIGEFSNPRGIRATPDGDIYVADMGNHRIVHLKMPKSKLRWVKTLGDTFLLAPFDVAVAPGGTLYITDTLRNSIVVMDTSGKIIDEFKKLHSPRGIDIDASTFRWSAIKKNFIVVVDSSGKKIVKIDRISGQIEKSVSMSKLGFPNADLQYIALDYLDNCYVPDSINCKIHKFDRKLNYIVSVGECGTKDEQFDHPRGIAIWRRFGQIIISERSGAQYFWVGVDVKNLDFSLDKDNRKILLNFLITESAYVTVEIEGKSANGKKIDRQRLYRHRVSIGRRKLGIKIPSKIPAGKYKIYLIFEATYSSYKHFQKEFTEKIELLY